MTHTHKPYASDRIRRELRQLEWKYAKAQTDFARVQIENELQWLMTRLAACEAITRAANRATRGKH